jgi:hypothetical protein
VLFNVEYDAGHTIEGYFVPDGFADQPVITVSADGISRDLQCLEPREAVKASGRHSTGVVGFKVDSSVVPNIQGIEDLIITDAKSRLLIYRRPRPEFVKKRIIRLETQLIPLAATDLTLGEQFQYSTPRVERYGLETALQIFHLHNVDSIYLSGNLKVRVFEHFLERGFQAITVLTDPYYDMAERLIALKRFSELPDMTFGPRDQMLIGAAAEEFANVDLTSLKQLRAILKKINPAISRIVRMPLTKQLTTALPDEEPGRQSAAAALDVISRFTVTGLRRIPESFTHPVADLLGIQVESIAEPRIYKSVSHVATLLREIPEAEALLETDLIVYHFASEAITRSLAASEAFA